MIEVYKFFIGLGVTFLVIAGIYVVLALLEQLSGKEKNKDDKS